MYREIIYSCSRLDFDTFSHSWFLSILLAPSLEIWTHRIIVVISSWSSSVKWESDNMPNCWNFHISTPLCWYAGLSISFFRRSPQNRQVAVTTSLCKASGTPWTWFPLDNPSRRNLCVQRLLDFHQVWADFTEISGFLCCCFICIDSRGMYGNYHVYRALICNYAHF